MIAGGMSTVPPRGWHLPITWEGGTLTFNAPTRSELIARVENFRLTNDIPIGDVNKEVEDYIARGRTPKQLQPRTLRERVTSWKMNRALKPVELVSPVEATRRAEICLECPYNKVDWGDSCASCVSHAIRDLQLIRKNKDVPRSADLGACSVYGHDNRTAVWLDKNSLPHRSQLPEGPKVPCWLHDLDVDQPSSEEVN